MQLKEAIRLALSTLWSNRLRSFLTVIGNVVAVLSVVVLSVAGLQSAAWILPRVLR